MKNKQKAILIIGIEILCIILIYIFVNSKYVSMLPSCWIYETTGMLCPACGGTRCVIYMLQGNFVKAFLSHRIFFIGILYLLVLNVLCIINLIKKKKIGLWLYPKPWYAIVFAIILILDTIIKNLL